MEKNSKRNTCISWIDNIDCFYYINLDHRKDRRESIELQYSKLGIPKCKITRIAASYHKKGGIGCSMSHCRVLEDAIKMNYQTIVVNEDDWILNVTVKDANRLLDLCMSRLDLWNVILLGSNARVLKTSPTEHGEICKVLDSQTTSGFIVRGLNYFHILLRNFKTGLEKFKQNPAMEHLYCIDQYWKRLQTTDDWFITDPVIGKQISGFSDINQAYSDYDACAEDEILHDKNECGRNQYIPNTTQGRLNYEKYISSRNKYIKEGTE
jgi:hypothetical protein